MVQLLHVLQGIRCRRGLRFWFMITCVTGWFNDMLFDGNGESILFMGSKQNHTGRFRHGIHSVGVGDLSEYHFLARHYVRRCCCFFAPCRDTRRAGFSLFSQACRLVFY